MKAAGELEKALRNLEEITGMRTIPISKPLIFDVESPYDQHIIIDKRYWRVEFINETESSVEIEIRKRA